MTRGQLIIIKNEKLYSSGEFNGDMYPDSDGCCGQKGMELLKSCVDIDDFESKCNIFNKENYGYENYQIYDCSELLEDESRIDLSIDYFTYWFSDYLYFKNIGDDNVEIKTDQGIIILKPNGFCVCCFGDCDPDIIKYWENCELDSFSMYKEKIENLGWNITEYNKDENYIEIESYSPNGEEIIYYLDIDDIPGSAKRNYNSFDADEHAVECYQAYKGDLRQLLNDSEEIELMLEDLMNELN